MTKVDELRQFPDEEIMTRLEESKEELFNLRFQNATGQLENYKQLGLVKREVARLETILRERELDIESAPTPEVTSTKKRRWRKTKADEEVDASIHARVEGVEEEEDEIAEEELPEEEVSDEDVSEEEEKT
jgi:large subunit ribosomal protein L29